VGRGCRVPHSDGGGEDTLNGGSVEVGANLGEDIHLAEQSEEEHPLVRPLDDLGGIRLPLKVTGDGGAQELHRTHHLNCGAVDEKWGV